jgi:hypothetical protein
LSPRLESPRLGLALPAEGVARLRALRHEGGAALDRALTAEGAECRAALERALREMQAQAQAELQVQVHE